MKQTEITPHLFRTEYSKIVAVLCRSFNLQHMEVAEDIASATFLKASEYWAIRGIPDNPTAWLYTVAKNKAKDHLRRRAVFERAVKKNLQSEAAASGEPPAWEFDEKTIADSQLEMMFAVCNPVNSPDAQICLALQILCGFSVEEIAGAFLTKTETIKKRLQRARQTLRANQVQLTLVREPEIRMRLETVLKTIYLLFNEGYYSKTTDRLIRKDLCLEAIRLALLLTDHPATNTPPANALLALLCFQSSRLEARLTHDGEAVLFDEQDKSLWDKTLLQKGNYYLIRAYEKGKGAISKYHIEAAIAYWHTTGSEQNKWPQVLQLYNHLAIMEYSPVAALNRAFAYAKVHGAQEGIAEVEKLRLTDNASYHALLGYLYADSCREKAACHYKEALQRTKSSTEKQALWKQLERLQLADRFAFPSS